MLALFAALFIRLGMLGRPRDVLAAVTRATLQLAAVSLVVGW
ncbi:MAG: hypothetical protein ACRDRV_14665 [Pseudonocardiaceae bacterium]